MLLTVTSDCGNLAARLYSAPMGAKSVASEPEKDDPDISKPDDVTYVDLWSGLSSMMNSLDTESRKTVESLSIFSDAASIALNLRSLQVSRSYAGERLRTSTSDQSDGNILVVVLGI